MSQPKLVIFTNSFTCSLVNCKLYFFAMLPRSLVFTSSLPDIPKNLRPSLSIETIITFSGIIMSLILEGVSIIAASSERKLDESIKNVTNKKAKSTIGVMSMDGELLGILILGISF